MTGPGARAPARWATLTVFLGPPVAWLVHLLASYALVPAVCRGATPAWLHVVTAATLAADLACAALALRLRRRASDLPAEAAGRARFFADVGLAAAALFALIIVAEALYTFTGDPCAVVPGPVALLTAVTFGPAPLALAAVGGPPVTPDGLAGAWNPDPAAWAFVLFLVAAYAVGSARLHRRARGRGVDRPPRHVAFALGAGALAFAVLSPLDRLGEALFSAHMAQHLLLTAVAAPLLVLSRAPLLALWALPRAGRRRLGRLLTRPAVCRLRSALTAPAVAWALHAGSLWAWHAPPLYEGALESVALHAAEHASFVGSAALFWWVVVRRAGTRRLSHGVAVGWVFAAAVQASLLGVLITFSRTAWYPLHAPGAEAFGLTALEDQQLAGLLMWIPGGLTYLVAVLLLLRAWLRLADRAATAAAPREG